MANMRTVFVNPERCIGCRQCEFACAVAHSRSKNSTAALYEDPLPKPRIHVAPGATYNVSFPNRCRHCDPAPCEQVCPSGAITRDAGENLVLIDAHKCIACAMCAMVCPFDAVTFQAQANGMPARVVATKCDGCIERVREGQIPACAEACKVDALVYGDINQLVAAGRLEDSAIALGAARAETGTGTAPPNVAGWRAWGTSAAHLSEDI